MSDKEKLDLACSQLSMAIKNGELAKDYRKKWVEFALRGSTQTRNARAIQNRNSYYAK